MSGPFTYRLIYLLVYKYSPLFTHSLLLLLLLLLLLSTALQLLVQSFGLLNHFFPSSSILDKVFQFGTFNLCTCFLTSSSQRIFGLPVGLFEMGFQEGIALTILVSCIISIWPYHPSLCALAKLYGESSTKNFATSPCECTWKERHSVMLCRFYLTYRYVNSKTTVLN